MIRALARYEIKVGETSNVYFHLMKVIEKIIK